MLPPSGLIDHTAVSVPRPDPRDAEFIAGFLSLLVDRAAIDQEASERAAQAQRQTGQRIDVVLSELGLVSNDRLLVELSNYFSIEVAGIEAIPSAPVTDGLIDADFVRRAEVLPVADTDDLLTVVTVDAFAFDTLAGLSYAAGKNVAFKLISQKDMAQAIDRLYPSDAALEDVEGDLPVNAEFVHESDVQRLRDIASEAPVIRLVNRLIAYAVESQASDIHIEPTDAGLRVRYRLDGVMTEVERLPADIVAAVASRIKILSKLDIAERRLPQDGRSKIVVEGREIDLRVSTMPTFHGESIVIRILDQQAVELSFDALGFDESSQAVFDRFLSLANGIVLVTGPTGSGKTTTLYTALKMLNSVERTIFTVEDPIEYQLAGINQIQIKPSIGLDFAHCLRSILRQDPDIIMVGEMRDVETARTGIQAALTGHLVLSTLHTNSAAAAVARLLDMGVEDYLLASTLSGVIAQRLVRVLCKHCAAPDQLLGDRIEELLAEFPPNRLPHGGHRLLKPIGCRHCRETGYHGRSSIIEALVVDQTVRAAIKHGANDKDVEQAAIAAGMETLYQSGLRKVLNGETSLDEVLRVTRA